MIASLPGLSSSGVPDFLIPHRHPLVFGHGVLPSGMAFLSHLWCQVRTTSNANHSSFNSLFTRTRRRHPWLLHFDVCQSQTRHFWRSFLQIARNISTFTPHLSLICVFNRSHLTLGCIPFLHDPGSCHYPRMSTILDPQI
jgi:hypothetical protein